MRQLSPDDQRMIESAERPVFEGWVKRVHPGCWPNPEMDGTQVFSGGPYVGQYYHVQLNFMWQSWLARALIDRAAPHFGGTQR